jgi:hypothetical protein
MHSELKGLGKDVSTNPFIITRDLIFKEGFFKLYKGVTAG